MKSYLFLFFIFSKKQIINSYQLQYDNNIKKLNRKIKMFSNKIKNHNNILCAFCQGCGFVDCRKCKNGCWNCNNTTKEKCPVCGGDGKGRLCYSKFPILTLCHNN